MHAKLHHNQISMKEDVNIVDDLDDARAGSLPTFASLHHLLHSSTALLPLLLLSPATQASYSNHVGRHLLPMAAPDAVDQIFVLARSCSPYGLKLWKLSPP